MRATTDKHPACVRACACVFVCVCAADAFRTYNESQRHAGGTVWSERFAHQSHARAWALSSQRLVSGIPVDINKNDSQYCAQQMP